MTPRSLTGRRRAVALALSACFAASLLATPTTAQEADSAELKAEYDEVLGQEAELLQKLSEAQAARRESAEKLTDLQAQTKVKQIELIGAQQQLQLAEIVVEEKVEERKAAERRVELAQERLRKQIVASYVTGGDQGGMLEAFLNAESGEQVGQALAYGRAVSGSTESLVSELDDARVASAEAAEAARDAKQDAKASRDDIDDAATFLVDAQALQAAQVQALNVQVLTEADALREVQGRKALVEGRINAMTRASDGVQQILAAIQAGQPDWRPGVFEITTPMPGVIPSSPFGMRHHPILGVDRLHAGADMGAPSGAKIYAPADGMVVLAEVRGGYGNTVVIDHGNSLGTLYGHTSQMLVTAGQAVERGDVIALVGSTGLSTGPHLHFETRIKGIPINPEGIIDFTQEVDYESPDFGD